MVIHYKILLIQNNIAEENFINFLSNSNQSFSLQELINFIINILIPLNFYKFYNVIWSYTFNFLFFFLNFKKLLSYYFFNNMFMFSKRSDIKNFYR